MSKKVLILVILTVATLTASLLATESRMASMGGMNGYVRDNTDIFTYPGTIFKYNKFVTMEMRSSGNTTDWSLGADLPLASGIIGVYFNEPTAIDVDSYFNSHSDYESGDLSIAHKLDIFYGIKEGLGVGLGLSSDAFSPNTDVLTENAMYVDLKAGFSTDMMDTGIIILLPMGKVENKLSKEKTTFMNIGVDLNGRLYLIQKDDWSLSGLAELGFMSSTAKHKITSEVKQTISDVSFNLGLGINYNVTENTLLAIGIKPFGLVSEGRKTDPSTTEYTLASVVVPEFKVGIESWVLPWLVVRAGATDTYTYSSYTTDSAPTKADVTSTYYYYSFNSQVGLGFKFGNFTVDSVINNELLFDGPDAVGGRSPGVASKLSLGYTF